VVSVEVVEAMADDLGPDSLLVPAVPTCCFGAE